MLKKVGKICQECRKEKHKLQQEVAEDTGYSVENISAFENGRNDNLKIFLWYICNTDLTTDDILKGGVNNG